MIQKNLATQISPSNAMLLAKTNSDAQKTGEESRLKTRIMPGGLWEIKIGEDDDQIAQSRSLVVDY
jgi:hypothetical protein